MTTPILHLAFPLAIDGDLPRAAAYESYIAQLIEQVLFTMTGERVNRPQFGCGLDRLVLRPMNDQVASATQYLVQSQLQQALAGVASIQSVEVSVEGTTLTINAAYVLTGSGPAMSATYQRTILHGVTS